MENHLKQMAEVDRNLKIEWPDKYLDLYQLWNIPSKNKNPKKEKLYYSSVSISKNSKTYELTLSKCPIVRKEGGVWRKPFLFSLSL